MPIQKVVTKSFYRGETQKEAGSRPCVLVITGKLLLKYNLKKFLSENNTGTCKEMVLGKTTAF